MQPALLRGCSEQVVNQAKPLKSGFISCSEQIKEYNREQVLLMPTLHILGCDARFRNVSFCKEPSKNCHPANDCLRNCNMEILGKGQCLALIKGCSICGEQNNCTWFLETSLKIQTSGNPRGAGCTAQHIMV